MGVLFTQLSGCDIGFTATAVGTVASALVMLVALRAWPAPQAAGGSGAPLLSSSAADLPPLNSVYN